MGLDLHLHTQASDGTLTPERLWPRQPPKRPDRDRRYRPRYHRFPGPGGRAAAAHGLLIPGIEVSASYTRHTAFHILGYGIDPENRELQAVLRHNLSAWEKMRKIRSWL